MRILVTGAAGFIGQHLCAELALAGHPTLEVDHHGRPGGPHDLRVPGEIESLLDTHPPDVVVHLAAKVGRLFGEDDVAETIATNAGMTATVAKACGERGIRLAYASTSEVYGDPGDQTAVEDPSDHPRRITAGQRLPHNIYGLSKRWGEDACRLYAPERLTIWRISMPYGPGLPAGRGRAAIINMLHQALHRRPIPVHRGAERSFCWIGDTVRALRLTLEREPAGGVYNIGRDDDPRPMRQIAQLACDLTRADYGLICEIDPPGQQTVVKRLATSKIRQLGWEPQVELEDGIRRTLEWVRQLPETA